MKTPFTLTLDKPADFQLVQQVHLLKVKVHYHFVSIGNKKMMFKFNLSLAITGVVFGLTLLAAPSAANAQCGYGGGGLYSAAPAYSYGSSRAPSYRYSNNYYAPSWGSNQSFYGGNVNNVRQDRMRKALTLAAVAGVAIALSNNDDRDRHNRNRNRNSGNRNRNHHHHR